MLTLRTLISEIALCALATDDVASRIILVRGPVTCSREPTPFSLMFPAREGALPINRQHVTTTWRPTQRLT